VVKLVDVSVMVALSRRGGRGWRADIEAREVSRGWSWRSGAGGLGRDHRIWWRAWWLGVLVSLGELARVSGVRVRGDCAGWRQGGR